MRSGDGDAVVRVPKFTSTFDGRVSGTTQSVPLTSPFLTHGWVSAVLSLRLHEKSWTTGTATVTVAVQNVVQTPDDPSVIYASDLQTQVIAVADAAPRLYTVNIGTPIGPMLRLVLRFDQGATAGPNTFAISIDLVGRSY